VRPREIEFAVLRLENQASGGIEVIDATSIIDYTYDDFAHGIDNIVALLQDPEFGFKPDYIVGIVRGGAIPAVYLSHKLKIPVQMVHWSTRDKTDDWGNESNCWIPEDLLAGKKILLVDDIIDGGETIKELLDDWKTSVHQDLPLQNIQLVCMYYNTAQESFAGINVVSDRTIDRNEDQRWIVFPWEG
jgi:uncharacterized protein